MMTMGSSIQWYAKKGGPSQFPKLPWMINLTDENATAAMRGDWDWETGIGRDPISEAERIRDYGMLLAYSNWAHVKNSPKTSGRFADKELAWVASVAGRRESRGGQQYQSHENGGCRCGNFLDSRFHKRFLRSSTPACWADFSFFSFL